MGGAGEIGGRAGDAGACRDGRARRGAVGAGEASVHAGSMGCRCAACGSEEYAGTLGALRLPVRR